jgi:HSP20 family protein
MTLLRFDPFRELDRLTEQAMSVTARVARSMPIEALRRGEEFLIYVDLPGVDSADTDVTVERNVVSIKARRGSPRKDGDEVLVDERPHGQFSRQLLLGDNLDANRLEADLTDGVLTLRIPVSEASRPRRIELGSRREIGDQGEQGSSTTSDGGSDTRSDTASDTRSDTSAQPTRA